MLAFQDCSRVIGLAAFDMFRVEKGKQVKLEVFDFPVTEKITSDNRGCDNLGFLRQLGVIGDISMLGKSE